ncbi:hypothetical protein ACHAXR_008489 [Thalassiosira sp. AJA248-18]
MNAHALHGLSSLAAEIPPLPTARNDGEETHGMKEEAMTNGGTGATRIEEVHCFGKAPFVLSARDLAEEAALIKMEQARRRSSIAVSSSSASLSAWSSSGLMSSAAAAATGLPSLYRNSASAAVNGLPPASSSQIMNHLLLLAGPSALTRTAAPTIAPHYHHVLGHSRRHQPQQLPPRSAAQYDALPAVGGGSGGRPLLLQARLQAHNPATTSIMYGSGPSADMLTRACGPAEARSRASWLNATHQRISRQESLLARQQQHQQRILIQDHFHLYQKNSYQDKFLGQQAAEELGISALPTSLRAQNIMMAGSSVLRQQSEPSRFEPSSEIFAPTAEVEKSSATDETTPEHPHMDKTLFLPTDSSFLSEAHCLIRSACIELFISTDEDVQHDPGKGVARPLRAGQVGFRCVHCKNIPQDHQSRADQAVCYPSKREYIFESIKNYEMVHLKTCAHIPSETKSQYKSIMKRGYVPKRSQKLVRAYWAQAASEVGLVDTLHGLIYRGNAGMCGNGVMSKEMMEILEAARAEEDSFRNSKGVITSAVDEDIKYGKFVSVVTDETKQILDIAQKETTPFVLPDDFPTISDHTFLLFHQLLPCKPTMATIKRRRLNPEALHSLPGLCCKHCHQNDGINGMYFPLNIVSLGDSSFSQTLLMHISSCSFVPQEIKNALNELKALAQENKSCARRGAKKAFIEKVWKRMLHISEGNRTGGSEKN